MSEIFKEFAKIGLENGWIKQAEKKEDKLYGFKIEPEDILEKAHQEDPLVILKTHVPNNGMIHNLQQKQDIAADVATRTPKGNYQQYFYLKAYQDLMSKTIKAASDLDNQSKEHLAKLADECSGQLQKRAAWPVVLGIIVGLSALYGVLYTSNNPTAQGMKQDTVRALEKMKELFQEDSKSAQVLEPLRTELEKLSQFAASFYQYNDEILSAMLKVTGKDSADDKRKAIASNVKELLEGPKHDQIIKTFDQFKDICQEVSRLIPIAIQYLNKAEEQHRDPENSAWYMIKKLVRDYIYNSNYQDLAKILSNLQEDISQVPSNINQQLTTIQDLKSKTQTLPDNLKEILPAT